MNASPADRAARAQKGLAAQSQNRHPWKQQINARVAGLCGIDLGDIDPAVLVPPATQKLSKEYAMPDETAAAEPSGSSSEILLYQTEDHRTQIDVRLEGETV